MTRITISLSDEELRSVQERAAKQGFPAVEDYLHGLATGQLADEGGSDDEDFAAPSHLQVSSREQLAELLREGLAVPGRKYTDADFAEMRKELVERGRISKRS